MRRCHAAASRSHTRPHLRPHLHPHLNPVTTPPTPPTHTSHPPHPPPPLTPLPPPTLSRCGVWGGKGRRVSEATLRRTSVGLSPSQARRPTYISQVMTPKAYTSAALVRMPSVMSSGGLRVGWGRVGGWVVVGRKEGGEVGRRKAGRWQVGRWESWGVVGRGRGGARRGGGRAGSAYYPRAHTQTLSTHTRARTHMYSAQPRVRVRR